MSVAHRVSYDLLAQPPHVRKPSQVYSNMDDEPLYAQVQRRCKPRNVVEASQETSLEKFYGGKELANIAAFTIQKAFRAYRLRKRVSKLLSDRNEINVDTGLPVHAIAAPSPLPVDNIDLLILQAAGLETLSSIVHKKGDRKNFRRTQSFKVPKKRTQIEGPGPVPQPCPPLKGCYDIPKPPQRTVSFLARPTLPQKVSRQQERPLPPPPLSMINSTASNSAEGIYIHHQRALSDVQHLRSYSSPAPLSPPASLQIPMPSEDEPLPPPPYISPPLPSDPAPPTPSPPPPPPPPPEVLETTSRPQCESSSSASSIDSGFGRSSLIESPTHWNSPDVFEPRPSLNSEQPHQPLYGEVLPRKGPQRNYSILKKKSVKFLPEQAPEVVDEVTRRRHYRVGLNLFNQNPELGMEYLMKKSFLDYSPSSVGKFLRGRKGLSKTMIGQYLCQLQRPFNVQVLHCFIHEMDFSGLHLDIALRHLYQEVTPPASEAQKIEKLIEAFARRYIACNQLFANQFRSPDAIFVLSYAIVLLNTDLHSKAVKSKRMKRDDFVRNLRGADQGADLDTEMLQGIYDRIKENELKAGHDHVSQVARVEASIVYKKSQQSKQALATDSSRRLVCFCRLTEVPDVHKTTKVKADAHQRGVFLFNDLLVITKTVSKKDKTQHQYRHFLDLRNLRINVFSTNQFPFGVQLQDKLTGQIAATFNARSEADQQRFVNDIEECISEILEMERAKSLLNEDKTMINEDNAYETLC